MKHLILLFVIATLSIVLESCSPVNFATVTGPQQGCTSSKPCLNPNGSQHVDQVVQFSNSNRVDILVIVDNSNSMVTEQNNLASAFNGFIDNLNAAGLDWQIAVTNTDICPNSTAPSTFCPGPSGIPGANGSFMGPLGANPRYGSQYLLKSSDFTSNMGAAKQLFANMVQRFGEVGSGDERPIYAANLVLDKSSGEDAALFRDNSNFVIVILSDEDERSVGMRDLNDPSYAAFENYDYVQSLLNHFSSISWRTPKQFQINSIIINPNDTAMYPDPNQGGAMTSCLNLQAHQPPSNAAHVGVTMAQAAQSTAGGQVGSICDNGSGAFASMLRNISGAISNMPLSTEIALDYIPLARPVVTFSSGENIGFTWTDGSNKITLARRPTSGFATISFDYFSSAQKNYMPNRFNPSTYNFFREPMTGFPVKTKD